MSQKRVREMRDGGTSEGGQTQRPPHRRGGAPVDISTADIEFGDAAMPQKAPAPSIATVRDAPTAEATQAAMVSQGKDPFFQKKKFVPGTGPAIDQVAGPVPAWLRKGASQRRVGGGVLSATSTAAAAATPLNPSSVAAATTTDRMDALVSAKIVQTPHERHQNLQVMLQRDLAATQPPSLWVRLLEGGSGLDTEVWDAPFYGDAGGGAQAPVGTTKVLRHDAFHNLLHHPVIPLHPLVQDALAFDRDVSEHGGMKLVKTKEEVRAERRRAAMEKQEQQRAAAAQKKTAPSSSASAAPAHEDQLRWKNMHDAVRLKQLASDPHALHEAIEQQYRERFERHQLDNYNRHVAALPHQIAKKDADAWRRAEECPRLHAYYVPKVRNPDCVNRLRTYANDVRLRGFLLWVAEEALFVVLAGGAVAMRHLDRWILEKMEWHRPGRQVKSQQHTEGGVAPVGSESGGGAAFDEATATKLRRVDPSILERTAGILVASIPLFLVGDVSFLLPHKSLEEMKGRRRLSGQEESVFVRHCASVEEASRFVREEMPAGGIVPSLDFLWRMACTQQLQQTAAVVPV